MPVSAMVASPSLQAGKHLVSGLAVRHLANGPQDAPCSSAVSARKRRLSHVNGSAEISDEGDGNSESNNNGCQPAEQPQTGMRDTAG